MSAIACLGVITMCSSASSQARPTVGFKTGQSGQGGQTGRFETKTIELPHEIRNQIGDRDLGRRKSQFQVESKTICADIETHKKGADPGLSHKRKYKSAQGERERHEEERTSKALKMVATEALITIEQKARDQKRGQSKIAKEVAGPSENVGGSEKAEIRNRLQTRARMGKPQSAHTIESGVWTGRLRSRNTRPH
ncbi:hypothetical protein GGR57DRAFT_349912 [Xylariaceae sp. FL1272]|nr:hypothetical protein GGR57DRAFT_349912 [Xylariaceae sp. FL1272]